MRREILYRSPDYTEEDEKEMKQYYKDMDKIRRKRAKMTPSERAKQDRELKGLHSKMQAGIDT